MAHLGHRNLRARDYDPVTGQFLTVDPAVDSTRQPYAYTGNSPVSRTDPSGLDWQDEVAAFGLGALDGATMGASSMLLSATVPGYDCFIQEHNTAFQVGSVATQVVVAVVTIVATAGAGTVLVAARYAAQLGVRVALKASVAETRRLVVTAARRFADDTGSIALSAGSRTAVSSAERSSVTAVSVFKQWPGGDGFLGASRTAVLKPGTLVDRYGGYSGRFVSPQGTAFQSRGMPSTRSSDPYSVFQVERRTVVRAGVAAPWLDSGGGAIQFLLPASVEDLLRAGYLSIVR